ncbi:MAG: T9SS type A sorting domain-containing protein, partial [Paludibacteraceae bacterium]|nr:T9SS type A sorting domain-containing protein [Paludibacteraceae bacterium]
TYYYRAYAVIAGKTQLSGEIRFFATDPCIPQYGGLSDKYVDGTPIVYTINADPAFAANDCKLHFKSLQDAIDHLKKTKDRDNDYKYVDGSYNLLQPVEMRVVYYDDTPDDDKKAYAYRGTTAYGMTAGNVTPTNVNLIEDINKTASNSANTLTIKAGTSKAKPWIHHIVIRNSKNIVLDSLCIFSDPTGRKDNALEIDVNSTSWPNIQPNFENANIVIQNSIIGSAGFTGVHVSGYDGITFKGNEIEASFTADANQRKNTITWGASAKFVACKNIKFIQNNFRGSQPTLLWLQDSQNALFMNNVFWNTNTFLKENDNEVTPTAIKLVNQYGRDINKIGFFYNTFYFAENTIVSTSRYNFFTEYLAASDGSTTGTQYFKEHIYFQYNNCYSYDTDCPGKDAFVGRGSGDGDNVSFSVVSESSNNANFCPNNFWSQYDLANNKTKSVFAFSECANTFTNVKTQVCETTASGPASLIVKGSAMNTGAKLSIEDIAAKTGIELTDKESKSDRYLIDVRPKDDTWTIGAYQSKDNIDTKLIYWVGVTDDWDDRNNWEYETEVDGKMFRQRVSCVNNFSEDLKVVIEEIGTVEVADGRKWPQIPESFTENRTNSEYDEHVSAGLGTGKTPTKFASTIELEYGAGIKGVENLKDSEGNVLYDQAIVHFDADRSKWLLVGNVIKPWDEKNKQYRSSVSGDYYLNHVPQVYMHKAYFDEDADTVKWDKTFANLEIPVPSDEVYAINVTGYYGTSWYPVKSYNKRYGTNYSDTEPQPYVFTGRFAITEETEGGNNFVYPSWNDKNLFNNVYPCNLNASYIDEHIGSVSIYDYEKGSFVPLAKLGSRADILIRSQNGFVIENNKGKSNFEITQDLLDGGSTRTRSTAVELPTFSLLVDNANTTAPGASNVIVRLDENQDIGYQSPFNTSKVFTQNENTPEAYLISNDAMYSRLYVGKDVKRIPLGIRLRKGMNITFKQVYNEGFDKVILLDTHTGKEYNLLHRSYTTEMLQGTVEGRFYLVFTIEEQDDNQDDDFTTDIEDALTEQASINIYAVGSSTVRVLSNNTELQQIYVSDMAGRTMRYDASGNFAELQLPVSQGVYLVQVIADNATRTEKVILK